MMLRDCAEPFKPSRTTFKPPPEAHLIGTYLPDDKTVQYIAGVQERLELRSHTDTQININNGNFEMRDIPCLVKFEGPRFLVSFKRDKPWNTFYENGTWRMYFDSDYKEGISVEMIGDKPPYQIRLTAGDPSINEPLTFVRFDR